MKAATKPKKEGITMIQRTNEHGAAMLRRLAKGAHIVRSGDLIKMGGDWVVRSAAGRMHVVNGACDCADYAHRKGEHGGWCKHRLAVYLAQQVEETGKPLQEWLKTAVDSVIKKHPAANGKAGNGAQANYTQHGSATEAIWQERLERLEREVYAMRKALEDHLTRYEKHLEARRAFAPR